MLQKFFTTAIIFFAVIQPHQSFSQAPVRILFDASKAETAGNADWVIDADMHNLN